MPAPWTRAAIRREAKRLLQACAVEAPPVPVEQIASRLGAQIRYEPFEGDLSGLLYPERGRPVIGVNSLHPKSRQRFTVAHEVAHLVLHQPKQLHVDREFQVHLRDQRSSQAVDAVEIQANAFAAELLMPAHLLVRDIDDQTVDYDDDAVLRRLADRYKVSLQAMIFRLARLGLIETDADSGV
jgi:Zn-dependent peptidase ImmA (M78 family)